MAEIRYYSDDDTPNIVIRHTAPADIHVIRRNDTDWVKLHQDNSYLRELILGQGNNCMTEITVNQAKKLAERLLFHDIHSGNKKNIDNLF